ncbi:keratin, type I cytoskeletal 50 kDa-like isoform X2 [Neoarius graeffei]|uniref:keratin, type I cytoskeletal 50 kDa-like isoform X2 n=1 Tax=Neoarius graeffei TaxID=443677 RepID=UPI00298BD6C7|nr:keratin, type I cytoskeletal 50 kDa-like isoform X2 [Neoarius graeffei]
MARSSRTQFTSQSLSLGSGGGRSSGLWAGSVHGGSGGRGVYISQAPQSLLASGYRTSFGGGYGSSVGLGSGFSVGLGSSIGASSAAVLGTSSATRFGGGYGSSTGLGGGAAFKLGAEFGDAFGGADVGILGNEKFTLRVLNDRLASYLKKVQLLEKANAELELKISEFVDSRTSPTARDYSDSLSTISDLQTKILDAILSKGAIQLNFDNASLAADDFRIKYENEVAIRQSVEADISGLRRLLEDINLSMKELTLHIDTLKDEKNFLKKTHEEEMVSTRSQMSGQIHVEVEAPDQDLNSILEDIRDHYETVAAKNRRELEGWFKGKLETLKQEVATGAQTIASSKTEMTTEKTKVQSLELELQSVLAVKTSLGAKLHETQAFYSAHLSGYQLQVTSLEEQLLQLRADLERQGRDYQMLLDIKTRLELEIAEYSRLLDLGGSRSASVFAEKSKQSIKISTSKTDTTTKEEEKIEDKTNEPEKLDH